MLVHFAEFFSNGPSRVIGELVRFSSTGDRAKLYGRARSRFSMRKVVITLGVVIATRRMTGNGNQSGVVLEIPRTPLRSHSQPSLIHIATSHSESRPSFGR